TSSDQPPRPQIQNPRGELESERGQRLLCVRWVPPDSFAQIGGNDARGVVAAQPGDVASGMGGAAAQIEARNGCAITAGARERAMVPNLVVGERADQQVSATHVGQRGFCVGWTEDKL